MSKPRSFESFGAIVDVGKTTLLRWLDAHEEFRTAFEIGRSKHLLAMEDVGCGNLVESYQGPKVNSALYKLFMANIHGWREKTDAEVKSETSVNITIDQDDADF